MDGGSWVRELLAVAAVLSIPAFLIAPFLLLTMFRPQIQGDPYYALWLARTQPTFRDFQAENVTLGPSGIEPPLTADSKDDLETKRIGIYERHGGLFLVHAWRPSLEEGQVADIVVESHQHSYPGGQAPLDEELVESVEGKNLRLQRKISPERDA